MLSLSHAFSISESTLTLGRTRKLIPPPWFKMGWMEPLLGVFYMLQYFETILPLVGSFHLLNKMRYILWVVALLGACDVTNNGRHFSRHLGFYQELEIRTKPRAMVFFVLYLKNNK